MKRTEDQREVDDIHCPNELINDIQQQSKNVDFVCGTDDYDIYLKEKKPPLRYSYKVAVFIALIIPSILLVKHIYQSFSKENPILSTQDNNVQTEEYISTNDNQDETDFSANENEPKYVQQETNSFFKDNYPDFQWSLNVKDDGSYYDLWNAKNNLRITISPNKDIALVNHNGLSLEVSLPYEFSLTTASSSTSMYLHDTIGNGEEQLVVISSVEGTRGTTWNLDIYDLNKMTQIPIQEDLSWLTSQMDIDVLSYYDARITYTLTVPDNTTYLMSEFIGHISNFNSDDVQYNLIPTFTDGIDEITDYRISEEAFGQVTYELKKDAPGLRITYLVTPYLMRSIISCGQIVADYTFDGVQFVIKRDSVQYLQPNANINELVVDAKEYQSPKNNVSNNKFSTWYLSGSYNSSNRLLIQLMNKAKEIPWVTDATLITNGTKIPLKQLQNKSDVHILWSHTGDSMVISYQYYQPLPNYDKETFFVYDITENKVVYEDALTFETMEKAFIKQGIYFMDCPSSGEAYESFRILGVNEKNKLIDVEYSFIDQNKLQRKGSFTYNYETDEYMNLVKNYQELIDQFNYWDNNQIGTDYKVLIITKLEEVMARQNILDTEMLTYLSPFLKVIEWNEFSLVEYSENPEFYGTSGRDTYHILWKPGYAKLIDVNGSSIQVKDIMQIHENEFILIANDYKFSNVEGINLIRLIITNNGMETSNITPDNIPEGYMYNESFYSNTGNISYTIEGKTIIFNNGKSEYRIEF